jgi:hypothetical protein
MLAWKIRPLVLAAACALLAGCGTSGPTTSPGGTTVRVTERDFHIGESVQRIRTGMVDVSLRNQGPDDHELLIAKESPGTPLPMRADGVTVNEEALDPVTVKPPLEPGRPGLVRNLRVHLAPGRYVLFCNMAGHYLGGMHTVLWVGR